MSPVEIGILAGIGAIVAFVWVSLLRSSARSGG
jgi:hypothetical protein